jgi:hypothetical protein
MFPLEHRPWGRVLPMKWREERRQGANWSRNLADDLGQLLFSSCAMFNFWISFEHHILVASRCSNRLLGASRGI